MKASELRIGNLVRGKDDKNEYTLSLIKDDKLNPKLEVDFSSLEPLYNFEPIPLTDEWLLKFGFSISEQGGDFDTWGNRGEIQRIYEISVDIPIIHDMFNMSDFLIAKMKDGYRMIRIGANYDEEEDVYLISNVFEYVHQLQNLFFSVTGEELNVNNIS